MAWFINIIFKDMVPSKDILERSLSIAIEDDIAIPYKICSIKNTSNCGAILFTFRLCVVGKVTNKLDDNYLAPSITCKSLFAGHTCRALFEFPRWHPTIWRQVGNRWTPTPRFCASQFLNRCTRPNRHPRGG